MKHVRGLKEAKERVFFRREYCLTEMSSRAIVVAATVVIAATAVVALVPAVAVLAFSGRRVWARGLGADQSNEGYNIIDTLVIEGCTHGSTSSNVWGTETIR